MPERDKERLVGVIPDLRKGVEAPTYLPPYHLVLTNRRIIGLQESIKKTFLKNLAGGLAGYALFGGGVLGFTIGKWLGISAVQNLGKDEPDPEKVEKTIEKLEKMKKVEIKREEIERIRLFEPSYDLLLIKTREKEHEFSNIDDEKFNLLKKGLSEAYPDKFKVL